MKRVSVQDELIDSIALLQTRHYLTRLDTLPFLIAYHLLMIAYLYLPSLSPSDSNKSSSSSLVLVGYGVCLAGQILLFLMNQFSVELKCFIGYRVVEEVSKASKVLVFPCQTAGSTRITDLTHHQNNSTPNTSLHLLGKEFSRSLATFEFQQVVYHFNPLSKTFAKISYPCEGTIRTYASAIGYQKDLDLSLAVHHWGKNEFHIPSPDFIDLYMEHLVAPFFVFQVLCLFLWSLDDYWLYSLLTLVMLLFFEGVLTQQRLMNLQMLKSMRRDPFSLYVYRLAKWNLVLSDQLVPGDVISLTSSSGVIANSSKQAQRSSIKRIIEKAIEKTTIPCDVVLIRGSCVVNEAMLTGESVPQIKESIRIAGEEESLDERVSLGDDSDPHPIWRRHMVFGGSALSQHSESSCDEDAMAKSGRGLGFTIPFAPDGGCQAVVVRTGYGTIQGGLMRKILFSTERITINSKETYAFIGVLIIFALISSGFVLYGGLIDPYRNRFKLILHCIMIVTSVVPPELPMELSLAVTNSLATLAKNLVYCTEPYRIPLAGRIDVLCFDKTGTLTQDRMILRGLVNPQTVPLFDIFEDSSCLNEIEDIPSSSITLIEADDCGNTVLAAMASCQALIHLGNGSIIGDPLEMESFKQSGFSVVSPMNDSLSSYSPSASTLKHSEKGLSLKVLHRYQFSSMLKRMSVIVDFTIKKNREGFATTRLMFTKGAPEVLQHRLKDIPLEYEQSYLYHMKSGKRVVALAWKRIECSQISPFPPRSGAESDLNFLGFLVFNSALKPETKSVIKELRNLNLPLIIVTGDNVYTAADVSRKLSMISKEKSLLVLEPHLLESQEIVKWKVVQLDEKEGRKEDLLDFQIETIPALGRQYSLCVSGQALLILEQNSFKSPLAHSYLDILRLLSPQVKIFSRVSPIQKELITKSLNEVGMHTLFCGDGTNDCGALKAAHVGISVINNQDLEKKVQESYDLQIDKDLSSSGSKKSTAQKDRQLRATLEIQHQKNDPTLVKLGDASIASPFTARRTSIECVLSVLRQGRCTLITTLQVYKVLALNCLVSAYMMSSLYLQGLKQGDTQMTVVGLVTAGLFYFISTAKPLTHLSEKRPPYSVFTFSVLFSIFGQFLVHICSLFLVLTLCHWPGLSRQDLVLEIDRPLADSRFNPNLVNTCVYLLYFMIQINNFFVNYRGHPFTENLTENIFLCRSLQLLYFLLLLLTTGAFEPLNDFLQLVTFPSIEFTYFFASILGVDLLLAYLTEQLARKLEG